jgi:hypothetical protein
MKEGGRRSPKTKAETSPRPRMARTTPTPRRQNRPELYGSKRDLSGVPEWGRPVRVHLDSGLKLDGRAAEARWVGFDGYSTHAHRIYWQDKNRVSIERNVRFTSNTVTVRIPLPFPSNTATSTQSQSTPTYLPTPPISKASTSTTTAPVATDSGEEEMPDEDEAQVEEQLKTPEQTAVPLPPSAPKKPAPAPVT